MSEVDTWSPLVDTHAHILAPELPRVPDATYVPKRSFTIDDYLTVLDEHRVAFGVLTAASLLGTYNDYTRAALRAHQRLRGTAIVHPEIDPSALSAMDDDGIVGIRYSLRRYKEVPDFTSPTHRRLLRRVIDLDWHVHLFAEPERMVSLVPQLVDSDVKLVLDHFGNIDDRLGDNCPVYQTVLRAIDQGRTWIKFSAPYRLNGTNPAGLATRLLSAAGPERIVWASDWPWTAHEGQFTYRDCIAWMEEWVPDRAIRDEIDRTSLKLFRFI